MPLSTKMRPTALAFAALALCGCTQGYLDRRDTIALSAGNAGQTNKVAHMVDPWPPYSGDTRLATNGQKMQSAVERYRDNKVIPPQGMSTANAYQAPAANTPAPAPVGQTVTQPAK
ncbi:MAG: hypothetical protein JO205_02480 [Pseudolabrys sp.]|nr:hypothetical protein [Pseudolabrys sp.]